MEVHISTDILFNPKLFEFVFETRELLLKFTKIKTLNDRDPTVLS